MPGIHIVFSKNPLSRSHVLDSYSNLKYRDDLKINEYFCGPNVSIAFSGYDGYPVQAYEDDKLLFLVEGLVYNMTSSEIEDHIMAIANDYLESHDFRQRIIGFIDVSDGDYLVLVYLKKLDEMIIFNDRWGRLPAFYTFHKDLFVLSREIKFTLNWLPTIVFNPIAMAEFLTFGYNLGNKTMIEGVKRLHPASLLHNMRSIDQVSLYCDELFPTDFTTEDEGLTREECIKKCSALFYKSLHDRVCKAKEVGLNIEADLSGGYDTRAVIFGLCNLGVDFACCSKSLANQYEGEIAREVASHCGRNVFQLAAPTYPSSDITKMRELTYITDCVANCWTTITSYYNSLEREKSIVKLCAHFMGFGGEFIRHPYRLKRLYRGIPEMIWGNAFACWLSVNDACDITKLNRLDFRNNIKSEVERFPESNDHDKIKHIYFEYYNKLVNGGENRHRLFSFTVQPLWGKELFSFEMQNIPPQMIDFVFFIDFLREIDSKAMEVPIYGSRVKLNSKLSVALFRLKMKLRNLMADNRCILRFKRRMFDQVRRIKGRSMEEKWVGEKIHNVFQRSKMVSSCLDLAAMKSFIQSSPGRFPLYYALTLALYLEEVEIRFGNKIQS